MPTLGAIELAGYEALQRKLRRLTKGAGVSISRAVMNAALGPLKREIRIGVNKVKVVSGKTKRGKLKYSSPTRLKSAARATIGSSVKKQPNGEYGAKAGFGVGKQTAAQTKRAKARASSDSSGVGLSKANIHWATLGTDERQTKSGKKTGKMPAFLQGIVPRAASAAKADMLRAAADKARVALAKEAAKGR